MFATLLLLFAVFVATQADAHGRTWDEGVQDWYGEATYQWYATRGADETFLRAAPQLQMPQHGPAFELAVAVAQHIFDDTDRWKVRSLVGGATGLLGLIGIALCGYELGGWGNRRRSARPSPDDSAGRAFGPANWWLAFLAAAGLASYPRYTGAIFNNSKDVPLTVAMIFLLWLTLRLARHWSAPGRYLVDGALLGGCLGVAVAIRVNALLWVGVLGLATITWWLRHRRTAFTKIGWVRPLTRQLATSLIIGGCGYLAILLLWPYVRLNPVDGLLDSIRSMSKYEWTGIIPFEGELIRADQLPHRYAPQWLLIGSPLSTVVLGLLGMGFIVIDLFRRRLAEPRVLLPAGALLVPLTALALMRPTLYNGLRHFLFVVPGLVLLGALALVRLWSVIADYGQRPATAQPPLDAPDRAPTTGPALDTPDPAPTARPPLDTPDRSVPAWHRRALATALVLLTALGGAEPALASARLYPFEYMYFSPLAGGYPGARDRYEADYWGVCQNPALDWLVHNYQQYPASSPPSVGGLFDPAVRTPAGFVFSDTPDFFITNPYYPTPERYLAIHTIVVYDKVLCAVTINPALRHGG